MFQYIKFFLIILYLFSFNNLFSSQDDFLINDFYSSSNFKAKPGESMQITEIISIEGSFQEETSAARYSLAKKALIAGSCVCVTMAVGLMFYYLSSLDNGEYCASCVGALF